MLAQWKVCFAALGLIFWPNAASNPFWVWVPCSKKCIPLSQSIICSYTVAYQTYVEFLFSLVIWEREAELRGRQKPDHSEESNWLFDEQILEKKFHLKLFRWENLFLLITFINRHALNMLLDVFKISLIWVALSNIRTAVDCHTNIYFFFIT